MYDNQEQINTAHSFDFFSRKSFNNYFLLRDRLLCMAPVQQLGVRKWSVVCAACCHMALPRIWEECSTIYSQPFFFFLLNEVEISSHNLCQATLHAEMATKSVRHALTVILSYGTGICCYAFMYYILGFYCFVHGFLYYSCTLKKKCYDKTHSHEQHLGPLWQSGKA